MEQNKPVVVIKYGGHAMDDPLLSVSFAESLARLVQDGMRFVVVHGGGPQINILLERLSVTSSFVDGLRVTSPAVMEAVEMVLCGQVNKSVVTLLQRHGVPSVGISGKDGELFAGHCLKPELGLVGAVDRVQPAVVHTLLGGGFVPVVAPVAMAQDGSSLNINADTAAGALAGALQAKYFVLVSDVPGVLDAQKRLIPALDRAAVERLRETGVIYGGMIPKVGACLTALDAGCERALILDGREQCSLERYLLEGAPFGTVVEK